MTECKNTRNHQQPKKKHPNYDDFCLKCRLWALDNMPAGGINQVHDPVTGLYFASLDGMDIIGSGETGVEALLYLSIEYLLKVSSKCT